LKVLEDGLQGFPIRACGRACAWLIGFDPDPIGKISRKMEKSRKIN
jgi:hypothetical protein